MIYRLLILLLLAAFHVGAAELQDPPKKLDAKEKAQVENGTLGPDLAKLDALRKALPPRAEFVQALEDIEASFRATLVSLQTQFTEASDETQARELQQAIHDLKLQAEIGLIEAQIALALHDGREEDAKKMDLILQGSKKFLTNPGD